MTRDEVIKALEYCVVSEIEWICPEECPRFSEYGSKSCEAALMRDALALLKQEPRRGKWVEIHGYVTPGGDPVWGCSECGKGIHVYGIEHTTYGADVSDGQWLACPNCGALMEGEDAECET